MERQLILVVLSFKSVLMRWLATSIGEKAGRGRVRGRSSGGRRRARRSRGDTGSGMTNHGCEVEAAGHVLVNEVVKGRDVSNVT